MAIHERRKDDSPIATMAGIVVSFAMEQRCEHRLLSAPHILYEVFQHLPQQDLLLIQRVCRVWHEVITSSQVLQAALFLRPAVDVPTNGASKEPVRMNPLLLSRFPDFFDTHMHYVSSEAVADGMGPYYSTHWAESIQPWAQFVEEGRCDDIDSDDEDSGSDGSHYYLGEVPTHLDAGRSAAYRRPEASWRRMIPCMPPPVELQIRYETISRQGIAGTLRRYRFDKPGGEDWLTFGFMYDIFEAAWFRAEPAAASAVQFDWTFQDEQSHKPHRHIDLRFLRDLLPGHSIGGAGRVLILLTGWTREQDEIDAKKRFRADFELQRLDGNAIEWDEVIPFESPFSLQ